ncbi:hypothetical protein NJ76_15700 [Rhodococcus sp. IITR03]|nr:hypothetical protein NJ76_15700 [Rhodococcus sp. IITR03]
MLTYRDLDERSTRLARMLLRHGAGPETFIAVGIARSVESVTAMWAITKTGAAFVPVDPRYPTERVAFMLDDCGATVGLTTTAHRDQLPDTVPCCCSTTSTATPRGRAPPRSTTPTAPSRCGSITPPT